MFLFTLEMKESDKNEIRDKKIVAKFEKLNCMENFKKIIWQQFAITPVLNSFNCCRSWNLMRNSKHLKRDKKVSSSISVSSFGAICILQEQFPYLPLQFSYQLAVRWQAGFTQSEWRRMTFAINYSRAFDSLRARTSYPIMMFRY